MSNLTSIKTLKQEPFLLLSIISALQAICVTLVWRAHEIGHLGMTLLFLFATGSVLWDKRHKLTFESGVFPSLVGIVLIAGVFWQSLYPNVDYTLRLLSFISALGVSLLASGFKGLKQYQEELIILFFLGTPSVIFNHFLDISPLTAKFSSLILWYIGYPDVVVNGIHINLPTGGIKVVESCSGMDTVLYLLGISVIALIMFPIGPKKRWMVPVVAMVVGFVVNAVRVAMLAIFAGTNQAAFDDWHGGRASYSYAMVGILIFSAYYMFLLWQEEKKEKGNKE